MQRAEFDSTSGGAGGRSFGRPWSAARLRPVTGTAGIERGASKPGAIDPSAWVTNGLRDRSKFRCRQCSTRDCKRGSEAYEIGVIPALRARCRAIET